MTVWLTAGTAGSDYDTTLSAYTAVARRARLALACNNDTGGPQSEVTFLADAGVTYYLIGRRRHRRGRLELALDIRSPLAQIGVKTTRAYEGYPAAGADALAWAQWPFRRGRAWTAFVQRDGEAARSSEPSRNQRDSGAIDGDVFVFQETRRSQSSLYFYDLVTRARSAPPAGVNTRHWEWSPTVSGDWLLFGRDLVARKRDQVILRNLATGASILLDQIRYTGEERGSRPRPGERETGCWLAPLHAAVRRVPL